VAVFPYLAVCATAAYAQPANRTAAEAVELHQQVIYLVMTDRFCNGDPNNDALGGPGENDPSGKNLRKFHGGDLVGVEKRLDYLKKLGVNTIWITPVYKQVNKLKNDATGYHGYWPDFSDPDDSAIDPRVGTKRELRDLIAALHKQNMRFILDKVVNHAGYDARITKQQPQWFHADRPMDPNDIITSPLAGLPDFKQEDIMVADYLTAMSRRWTKEFQLDGIRMDTAKHVPLAYFRDRWIPAVRQERPKLFLIAEVMNGPGEYASVKSLRKFLDAGFDSAFNFWLRDALVTSLGHGGSLNSVASVTAETWNELGEDRALLITNLLDNHDVKRFTNEPGPGVSEPEIQRRYHAGLVLLFTLPGIPQLYYGDELGMYGDQDPDNRRSMPCWAWTAEDRKRPRADRDPVDPRLCLPEPDASFNRCRSLLALRKNNPALQSGYYVELWRPAGGQNVYAFFRGAKESRIVVLLNDSGQPFGPLGVPLQGNANLRPADKNAFKDGAILERLIDQNGAPETVQVSEGKLVVTLPAKSAGVYRLR